MKAMTLLGAAAAVAFSVLLAPPAQAKDWTKVVIATTLTMSLLLWAVDLCFGYFFWKIGVLIGATNS